MPFFDASKWQYFGCIHIKKFAIIAAICAAIVQVYLSVFFLTLHDWWAFISFSVSIVSYLVFIISIRRQSWIMLVFFFIYQVLITIVTFAAAIWMMITLISPMNSWMWKRKCQDYKKGIWYDHCDKSVKTLAGTYFGVFMLFFIINLMCLHVFFFYWKFVRMESRSSGRPARAARSAPATRPYTPAPYTPAPYTPAPPPQPPRGQAVPMETVTVSTPIRPSTTMVPPLAATTQYNPYSPGNQFPSQPIQQPVQQPTQNWQYQPTTAMMLPPPPRNPFPTEDDWNSPTSVMPTATSRNAFTVSPSAPQVSPGYGVEGYPTVRGMPAAYNPYRDDPATNPPYAGGNIPQQSFTDGYPTVRGIPPTSPTSRLYDAPPPYSDPKY